MVQVTNVAPTVQFGVIQLLASATDPAGAADPVTLAWDLDGDGLFGETGAAAVRDDETRSMQSS